MAFNRKAYITAYNKSKYQERKEYNRQWYQTHRAKNKISVSYDKEYINKLSNANYHKNKHKNKHTHAWRNLLRRTLEYKGVKKNASTLILLRYTAQQLKQRIECQFKDGMSWDNYGVYWEIDHKKALSRFNEGTPPSIVNALSNLQPLIISLNRKKSKKIWKTEF